MSSMTTQSTSKAPKANDKVSSPEPDSPGGSLHREIDQLSSAANFSELPRAFGQPELSGVMRRYPADFQVSEVLPIAPSGSGEHLLVNVRKTGQNTRWVAKRLAERAGIPFRSVGLAGLKDRHAVAEQWFSLHLPGRSDPSPDELAMPGVEVLSLARHGSKLRIGMVQANRFRIVVRELQGDPAQLDGKVQRIIDDGVPNYFGPQRFGRQRRNLTLLVNGSGIGREARSFGLSALRSALFNGYLAKRIEAGNWRHELDGEIVYLPQSRRYRHIDQPDTVDAVISPTGLLWGCGDNQATAEALQGELQFFNQFSAVKTLLVEHEVRMMRRPLMLTVDNFRCRREGDSLILNFELGRGAYATSVLREVVEAIDVASPPD